MTNLYRILVLGTFLTGLCRLLFSQGVDSFSYYKKLNDEEKRLEEYRDSDNDLKLKLRQLELINESRRKFRAPPVNLDILASRLANMMSREAAEREYVSHWNMKGEKPYHRYAFAGGYDHITENAYGEWSSRDYETTPELIAGLMKTGHMSFMAERAPNDGHKQNIINKTHTHVGIGFYISGNQFRYYEEFINRYLEYISVPSTLAVNENATITVDTRGESYLYFLICYRDPFPQPVRPGQKPRKGSYEDYSGEVIMRIPAWELSGYRKGTLYRIPVSFRKEGLYYIHIFISNKEITAPRAISTKGYDPVSGIVIKVRK